MPIGTTDFLIDVGNDLARLGYEFAVVTKERGRKGPWVCLSNAASQEQGREMIETLDYTLDRRFGGSQPWKPAT